MKTVCLIGNGVSVAYNSDLTVGQLTDDLLARFHDAGASEPELALARFADSQSRVPGDLFEALLGPLSSTAEALGHLPGLAALAQAAGADDVVTALGTASKFLSDVHRIGLAITLGHIAERSLGGRYDDIIFRTAAELVGLGAPGDLTVGTLNYDGLLHAGMLDAGRDGWGRTVFDIVDLAAGYTEEMHQVTPGDRLLGHRLRDFDDLLANRAALLQLHGSLGWLAQPADPTGVWRFELPELRDAEYWAHLRAGDTLWNPVVVLTDRKDRAVTNWPFSLAYEIFQRRLVDADRWLIVGYGLGDVPVNLLFATAAHERTRLRRPIPPTLVIGLTPDPDRLRVEATEALRIPPSVITALGLGIPEAYASGEWNRWANP